MGGGGTHIRFLLGARTRSPYMGGISTYTDIQKNIKKGVALKKFNTFRIGGPADFFVSVNSVDQLKEVLSYAQKEKLKVFVLGGGSNIVFSDDGFRGLVIKIEIKGIVSQSVGVQEVVLEVGGGEVWDDFVSFSISQNLYGVENLSAIPGTVGAAPVQNIGAYGVEVKDVIEKVEVIEIKTCKTKVFTKKECAFGYRDSFFKTQEGKKYIITNVSFNLKKDSVCNLSYVDLSNYFDRGKTPSLKAVREAIINIRSKKFPNLNEVGTAGSFFKNPVLTNREYKMVQNIFPSTPFYRVNKHYVKVPLGFIIEKLGWKEKKYGHVSIYKNQSLVIVNDTYATHKQLETFAHMIEEDVKEKVGIVIEREVMFVK